MDGGEGGVYSHTCQTRARERGKWQWGREWEIVWCERTPTEKEMQYKMSG